MGALADLYRPYVFHRVLSGSHAYGLAGPTSDEDWRGVFLPPARLHWSLAGVPEQFEEGDDGT